MKKLAYLLTIPAAMASATFAAPFLAVGDGAEIFLTGTLGVRADSNIYMASSATPSRSDTILEAKPGIELVFGKSSNVQGSLSLSEDILAYTDHSDLNNELFSGSFAASYSDGKSKGSVNLGYTETDQNQVGDLGGGQKVDFLIHKKSTNAGAKGEVGISEKTSVASGVQYLKTDYARAGFYDAEVVTVPLNLYYEVTPKVDLGVGYQYRKSWVQAKAPDSTDNFFNVRARGDFTPKLSGEIGIGVTQRDYAKIPDANLVGFDASFSYVVSPKTTLQFGGSNDFDTNSQGEQQKNLSLRASVTSNLTEQWALNAGLSYRAIDYFKASNPRTDDYYEANLGGTYILSEIVRFSGTYTYRNNRSVLGTSQFEDNVLTLTANFRY